MGFVDVLTHSQQHGPEAKSSKSTRDGQSSERCKRSCQKVTYNAGQYGEAGKSAKMLQGSCLSDKVPQVYYEGLYIEMFDYQTSVTD